MSNNPFHKVMHYVRTVEKDLYDVENPIVIGKDANLFLLHPNYVCETATAMMVQHLEKIYHNQYGWGKDLSQEDLIAWGWTKGCFEGNLEHPTGDDRRYLVFEWDQDSKELERLEFRHRYKNENKSESLYPEEVIGKIVMKLPQSKTLVGYHALSPFSQFMRVNPGANPSYPLDLFDKSFEQIYDRIVEIAELCGYTNLRG